MPRYLWHLDADGWPLERIDTHTGEHVPVFTGAPDESIHLQDGGRPIACCYPRTDGGCSSWLIPHVEDRRDR